tara:strand:+ start:4760 stop:7273 length:2514 start_codon:yes stop_codon:yes gene_type:complete
MSQFPQFSKPYPKLLQKIKGRAGSSALWNQGGPNGLTPWIRVISGVKGKGEGKENGLILQSNYPEDGFNIRYGGTKSQPSGVVGFDLNLNPVKEKTGRKLRPSPIITNLNIDETDIGRKKTKFDIICYSLEHMEQVAKYFLNPGFTVLVEWGWNTKDARKSWCGYEKSKKGKVEIEDIVAYNNFKHIKEKREKANYEYDATLGFITDGGLEFGDNETFKISVTLTSIGEVAEYMQNHTSAKKDGQISTPTLDENPEDERESTPEGENHLEVYFNCLVNDLPYGKKYSLKTFYGFEYLSSTKKKPLLKLGSIKEQEPDNGYHDISSLVNFNRKMIETTNMYGGLKSSRDTKKEPYGANEVKNSDNYTIIDEERFIRFELAVDILNSNVYDLDGTKDNKSSLVINIQDSFIGGHPNMFSTDGSKLFIPNTQAPDFSLDELLFSKDSDAEEIKNIIEWKKDGLVKSTMNMCPEPDGTITYKGTRSANGSNTPHAFPSTYDLDTKEIDDYKEWYNLDDTMETVKCDKGYWGWLKNLYINYDFFLDTLVKPNLFTKDILYELLNGMSTACGNQWKFQIVENPAKDKNGPTELTVIDEYFTGLAQLNITDNIFQLRGTISPFISADFKTDVPKAQQNSIIQKRLSQDNSFRTGDNGGYNDDLNRNVFGDKTLKDEVLIKISPITTKDLIPTKDDEQRKGFEENKKQNKKNKEFFLKRGTIIFKKPYQAGKTFNARGSSEYVTKEFISIAAWNDPDLLKQCRINAYAKKREEGQDNLNIPYGLAEVSFQVHGISGFKRGDYLQYEGLPNNFTTDAIYQVHEISHEVSNGGWFTNITTKMRPYKF